MCFVGWLWYAVLLLLFLPFWLFDRLLKIRLYLLIGLCLAVAACQRSKEEVGKPGVLKEETRDDFCGPLINYLDDGGRVYVGTIETVTAAEREPAGVGVVEESGKFTVRVLRAVRGPAVKEWHLSYSFFDYDPNQPNATLFGDWGGRGPWLKRPQVGEQVLLVLSLDPNPQGTNRKRLAEQNWERDAEVGHVWIGVSPDHPLVKDMAVAVQYLETRDSKARYACFRQLSRSAWPSIRGFARGAAFGSTYGWSHYPKHKEGDEDWSPESRLMVEYLKTAGPLLTDWERADLTLKLRCTLCSVSCWNTEHRRFADWVSRNANDAAAEWLAAFEDWYLTELGSDAMRPKPERSKRVLIELRTLVHHYGIAGTLALFRKRRLPGLEERLQVCTRSPDPALATNAKQWLDILRAGRKIAAGTITNTEGDPVSLQTVYLDTILHVDTIYRAENLPPDVRIDPATGVISGRLKEGAAKNSPYEVSVFYGPRQRQYPSEENRTQFIWQLLPKKGDS